jgi:hypothetical protein
MKAIHAAQSLIEYLRFTKKLGLTVIFGNMRSISTYAVSSFGDVIHDRRSTTGQITYIFKVSSMGKPGETAQTW